MNRIPSVLSIAPVASNGIGMVALTYACLEGVVIVIFRIRHFLFFLMCKLFCHRMYIYILLCYFAS